MRSFTKSLICLFLICSCVFLFSCAYNRYSDTLSCSDLTSSLQREILGKDEYLEYSESDVKYIFDDSDLFDSCSIIYSSSGDDLGEIGVLHAENEEKAQQLLEEALEHIEDEKEDKINFLRNYLPEEMSKFENAEARKYGNYVVFVFLDKNERDTVFNEIEDMLKNKG